MSRALARAVGLAALTLGGPARAGEGDATITVEGARTDAPPPGTSEIVVAERARPGDGLEDLLHTAPGVRVRRLGGLGAFAGVSLRGAGFRHTLVRLDGVPLNPDGVEGVDLASWPLAGLAAVRVTPGRAAATVGGAPIGGVVDLIPSSEPAASAEVGVGSYGSTRASAGATGAVGTRGDWLVAADAFATHGAFRYHDDGGTAYVADDDAWVRRGNNHRRQGAALARVRAGDEDGRVGALVSVAARDEGLPGAIGRPWAHAGLATRRALLSVDADLARGPARIGAQAWTLARHETLRDPDGELGRAGRRQDDRYTTVGGQLTATAALGARAGLRGSADARNERFFRDGDAVRAAARSAIGAAIDAPLHLGRGVVVTPGLDARALVAHKPGTGTTAAWLPGVMVAWAPSDATAAWASVGRAFRPPDLAELYGDRGALVGNPDLSPERATRGEVGARARHDGRVAIDAEATAWATATTDTIGWLQNTQRTVVAVNFGESLSFGADVGASASLGDRAGVRASVSLQRAIQTTDDPSRRGRPLPFVAPARGWGRAWASPFDGLTVGLDLDATTTAPVDPHGVTHQPGRALLGGHVAVRVGDSPFTVSLDVRNLTGARTGPIPRDPLGPDPARIAAPLTDFVGYPLPGRTAWLAVRFAPERR